MPTHIDGDLHVETVGGNTVLAMIDESGEVEMIANLPVESAMKLASFIHRATKRAAKAERRKKNERKRRERVERQRLVSAWNWHW